MNHLCVFLILLKNNVYVEITNLKAKIKALISHEVSQPLSHVYEKTNLNLSVHSKKTKRKIILDGVQNTMGKKIQMLRSIVKQEKLLPIKTLL